ncbi:MULTISPECIES: AAA domain-containing protein [unclassified Rhodococcus (in: high G+C Gram-positive bacteria)]|uniref:AAA domain-containing protein n=1 Tax=unclassified Rhodococcus (in: high G+C Gram-positive bacteria) TaxID=192944 RepID=UPI00163B08AE|nr:MULTISPECIES: AAA domain-containing protein [unclassified Rhodococcus (in: high G+C Gram-positive bacteria)]MBC2637514.1 DUF559 domain-containing protein [Rhodococcus sp. 3A]MBC2898394.1 DUF559 domain-containing protein [Rhodococcus sp. 4CII]
MQRATETFIGTARDEVVEYAELGGLTRSEGPWNGAPITTPEQVRVALDCVTQLSGHTLPRAANTLTAIVGETGLAEPQTVSNWPDLLRLLDGVADILKSFTPEVFEQDLSPLIAATASRGWRKQHAVTLGWGERRRLRKQARIYWHAGTPTTADLHTKLVAVQMVVVQWREACRDGRGPRLPADLPAVHGAFEQLTNNLAALTSHLNQPVDLETLSMVQLSRLVDDLIADQATLHRLPRRHHLETRLHGAGLGSFLDECRRLRINADHVAELLDRAWLQSILDEISFTDPTYGAFQGSTMTRTVTAFQQADTRHIRTTSARVQRACSETLFRVLDAYPDQTTLLRAEAGKKTRHRSMRELLAGAPDVLMALKPCWAMSPLVVSQVLPLQQLFDVVIFDEASQIPPADAIPAIVRGKRIAVAGDERQLPPTNFFGAASTDDDQPETDSDTVALTSGYESVLDALTAIVPFRGLAWHYRSQDERLIAFSNAHIYDRSLTTFPGSHTEGVLQHVQVPFIADPVATEESTAAEVDTVVALVLQHAQDRPDESLGVITMGLKHADRIEAALRAKLGGRPELNEFFLESRDERFFVKNLERVQGDERDAIILSIGYGKSADGRMVYRFGPLNNDGGERRLNVAVSRAKRRMTLVSSFGSTDLDPNRLHARGAQLLREYLAFMESGGKDLGSSTPVPPALNPFEIDVRDRLTRAGIPLTAQYGVGGYRIDFAAQHPEQRGRMVLAIEADGASYHSSHTARDRDRLRQEHLERLGWRFHRIWSTDWFRDPDTEVAKALTAYQIAVKDSDSHQRPRHTPEPAPPESEPMPDPFLSASRTGIKPAIYPGVPITEYTQSDLVALIKWIKSDGLLRTEDALVRTAMEELGYRRKGGRITVALENAIRSARDG